MSIDQMVREDGRTIAIHRFAEGNSSRRVVLCHAAPGSGAFDPDPEQTRARNVTLIAPNRPGYGESDPAVPGAWASVASAADDVAAVLDRDGSGPVGVAGWSAGGRIALALAARRPDLVDRLAVIGTPAPHEEVPWILPELQAQINALRGLDPDHVHGIMNEQFGAMLTGPMTPEAGLGMLGASEADSAVLAAPGAQDRIMHMLAIAFARGTTGLVQDLAGYTLQPWGFEPMDVTAKTLLLYGAKDPVAGSRHATWWKRHLPDARVEMVPNAGHLLVIPMWKRVLSHLAPGTGVTR